MTYNMGSTMLMMGQYFFIVQNFKFSFCNFFNLFVYKNEVFKYSRRNRTCTRNLHNIDSMAGSEIIDLKL